MSGANGEASPAGALEIAAGVRAGGLRAADVLEAHLARIQAAEPDIHAFNLVTEELALATANRVDEAVAAGRDPGPLAGVPVALKDNLCTRGVPTTLLVPDPGWLAAPLRRHGRAAPGGGGRGDCRQDQPRRVRHGIFDGELGLRAHPQSSGPAPGPGRVVGWQRRRRVGPLRPSGPGLGHRRIHSSARCALRRGRSQADLRPGLALRADRLRQLARSDRAAGDQRGRRRPVARRDLRPRPGRLHIASGCAAIGCRSSA